MLSVLRAHLDSFTIEAPILNVTFRALEMVPRCATPLHLFVPEAKAARTVPRLVAELEAELGPGRVGTLSLANRWLPHDCSRLVPINAPRVQAMRKLASPDSLKGSLLSGAPEPTRLERHSKNPSVTIKQRRFWRFSRYMGQPSDSTLALIPPAFGLLIVRPQRIVSSVPHWRTTGTGSVGARLYRFGSSGSITPSSKSSRRSS